MAWADFKNEDQIEKTVFNMTLKESDQEEDQDWDGNNGKEKCHTHEEKGYEQKLRRALGRKMERLGW
jgi:hypothetical protein